MNKNIQSFKQVAVPFEPLPEKILLESLFAIFDDNYDECFFLKDPDGVLLAVNHALVKRYQKKRKEDLLGRTDYELVPYELASKYRKDDLHILSTGEPMLSEVELVLSSSGKPLWSCTNKYPVFSSDGKVIAISGVIRSMDLKALVQRQAPEVWEHFTGIEDQIQTLSVDTLAEELGISVRGTERYFKKYLNITPSGFIAHLKIQKACDLLLANHSISETADVCGFYDQSSFTKFFKQQMGQTPKQYLSHSDHE